MHILHSIYSTHLHKNLRTAIALQYQDDIEYPFFLQGRRRQTEGIIKHNLRAKDFGNILTISR